MAFDADDWIRRDDRLVARTGRLPFNAEPPPATLLAGGDEGGAVTPAALHYVRNHAPVPRLEWAEHVLEVADDSSTVMLPMDALRDLFRPVDVLVTFACDGNRRGELNGIRRTLGFDFGPCAVSTGSWAGALLRDVLLRFFGERALDRYNYVCFEGCDALTNGTYGTSIPVALVKDPTTDVLVAYSLNGAAIPPDHGFPVRTIIPGFVGGRTVKWLKKIRLSKKESQSWYHFYDNRLLPSPVTSEGIATQYWKNPDYLIYEMNLNSVMLAPGHDEELKIGCLESLVHLQGYAYDGGGRRITRVELSLDDGQTWLLCDHQYPDGYHPRHGKRWWVMCKWSYSVEMYKLAIAKEIIVRAWNISHNTQPERRTWNLAGMMNNAWYRVKLRRVDARHLRFVHPVRMHPTQKRGYMQQEARSIVIYEDVPSRHYAWNEIKRHNRVDDCWVVLAGTVCDVTSFLSRHPGGPGSILAHAGTDATSVFHDIHSLSAQMLSRSYAIGHAGTAMSQTPHVGKREKHPRRTPDGHRILLSQHKWMKARLIKREKLTHNVRRFTFELESRKGRLWLPWGKHLDLAVVVGEKRMVVRPFTPVAPILPEEDNGTFSLVVKIYFPTNEHLGGEMTMILESMKPGDAVLYRGPNGHVFYSGQGIFCAMGHFLHCRKINFVVGGTGMTPALAVSKAILFAEEVGHDETEEHDPDTETESNLPHEDSEESTLQSGTESEGSPRGSDSREKVRGGRTWRTRPSCSAALISFVFSNKTLSDVICRDELDALARRFPERFRLRHVITCPPEDGRLPEGFLSGYVDERIVRQACYPPDGGDTACFVCGPPAMLLQAVVPALEALGFDEDNIFEF